MWTKTLTKLRTSLLTGIAAVAVSFSIAPESFARDLPFVTVAKQMYASYPQTVQGLESFRVNNEGDWESMWSYIYSDRATESNLPEIDFSEWSVVGALGYYNTGGYDLRITRVTEEELFVHLRVQETTPGAHCYVTLADAQPHHIVKIPHVDKPVYVTKTTRVVDCN